MAVKFFWCHAIDILMVETGFTATLSSLNNYNLYQTNNEPIQNEHFTEQLSKSFTVVIQHLSTRLIKPNFCFEHIKC